MPPPPASSPPSSGDCRSSLRHPGSAELDKFYASEDPVDLPDVDVLNDIFEYCSGYARCPKCLCFDAIARTGTSGLTCQTDGCYNKFPKDLLPSAYLLGLPKKTATPPAPASETMESDKDVDERRLLEIRIDRMETLMEKMANHMLQMFPPQPVQTTPVIANANQPIVISDDASQVVPRESTLYSRAHVAQPSHTFSWAKIAAKCPDNLKQELTEIRKENLQQDRAHRRNRKKSYSGTFTRIFVDGIPRFRAQKNEAGKITRTRHQRTETFLQAARIQTSRVHSIFPRGYKTYEFLVEDSYATNFRAALIDINCRACESFNPDAPRDPSVATEEQKEEVKRVSLEHYVRECMRTTASNAAKAFYREKGNALVGEVEFQYACSQYKAYSRKNTSDTAAATVNPVPSSATTRRRSLPQEEGFFTPISRKRTLSSDSNSDSGRRDVQMNTQ